MKQKLLIVAATNLEVAQVFEHFNLPDGDFIEQATFDLLITGVGMTATAFALGKHLKSSYHLVLNVGIAGSFDQQLPLGSVVSIGTDTFSELGAEDHDQFIPINVLGFGNNRFESTQDLPGLPKLDGITVNTVHGNDQRIAKVQSMFNVQTESMEGAAVFYACNAMNVPCAQARAISNYVTPRAKEDWKVGLAINNLNSWLIQFITDRYDGILALS